MENILKVKFLFGLVAAAMLSSCSSMNGKVGSYLNMDTDLQVEFMVDADINPDEARKPSPLFIRMYELKTPKMIRKADFIDIYERDKEVLGADMIAVHKLKRFKPGEGRAEHFVLDKNTHYVAFFAEFLKFSGAKYKVVVPVVASNVIQTSATIKVAGNDLVVVDSSNHDDGTDFNDNDNGMEKDVGSVKESAGKANDGVGSAKEMSSKNSDMF